MLQILAGAQTTWKRPEKRGSSTRDDIRGMVSGIGGRVRDISALPAHLQGFMKMAHKQALIDQQAVTVH